METGSSQTRKAAAGRRPEWADISGGAKAAPAPVRANLAEVRLHAPDPGPDAMGLAAGLATDAAKLLNSAAEFADQHDDILATNAATEYRRRMAQGLEGENGILRRSGEAAFECVQETGQFQQDTREELLTDRSQAVRQKFMNKVADFDAHCLNRAGQHAEKVKREYALRAHAAAAEEAADDAALSAGDPEAFGAAVVRLEEETAKYLTAQGYGGEALRHGVKKAVSGTMAAAVKNACELEDLQSARTLMKIAGQRLTGKDRIEAGTELLKAEKKAAEKARAAAERSRRAAEAAAAEERDAKLYEIFQNELLATDSPEAAAGAVMRHVVEQAGGKIPRGYAETVRKVRVWSSGESLIRSGKDAGDLERARAIWEQDAPISDRESALAGLGMRPGLAREVRKSVIVPEKARETAGLIFEQLQNDQDMRTASDLPQRSDSEEDAAAAAMLEASESDPEMLQAASAQLSAMLRKKRAMAAAVRTAQVAELAERGYVIRGHTGSLASADAAILADSEADAETKRQAVDRLERMTIGANDKDKRRKDLATAGRLAADPRFSLLPETEQIQKLRDAGISVGNIGEALRRAPMIARFPDATILNWVKTVEGGKRFLKSMDRRQREAFCDAVRQDERILAQDRPAPAKMREILRDAVAAGSAPAASLEEMETDPTLMGGIEAGMTDLYGQAWTKETSPEDRRLLASFLYAQRMGIRVNVSRDQAQRAARIQAALYRARAEKKQNRGSK
ncbi:MAG: hypothetical protein PUB69_00430 [Desulfovibrionaceae bacterium]|nr:hypothetical protein [Desulfovibrionaceae bacterium]